MKTTRFIGKAIMAACLCLGMTACGDDDNGNTPGGGNGEGGEQGEVQFAEGNGIADDGPNSREKRLKFIDFASTYSITYDNQGRPVRVGYVSEEYNFHYNAYELDGEVHRSIGVSNEEDKLVWGFDLNSDDLIESAYYKYYAGHDVTLQYTFEYDDNRQLVHATRTYTSSPNETDHVYNTWKNDNIATTTWELSSGNKLTTSYTYSDEPSWKALITRLSYAAGGYNQNYDPIGVGSPAFYLINLTGYFGKRPKNILDETITRNQAGKVTGRFRYVMEEGSQYVEKDEDGYYTDYAVESLDGSSVKSRAIYDITWWE